MDQQSETAGPSASGIEPAGNIPTRNDLVATIGSLKRRSIRRSWSCERPETRYGTNAADYDAIRERVYEEPAVVNAIEALQERWRTMLTPMYDDCVELNEGRKERRLRKLCIKRQIELIVIIALFLLMCVPVAMIMFFFVVVVLGQIAVIISQVVFLFGNVSQVVSLWEFSFCRDVNGTVTTPQ